jgi:cytochrome c-type biogenesis protein CcmH
MSTGTLFWGLALALVLATLLALVVPLLRTRTSRERPADADASTAIYRDQKHELDADVASGAITADERDATGAELVARLGAELASEAPAPTVPAGRAPWITAMALVALVPAIALVAYLALGRPEALDAGIARQRFSDTEILAMVDRLAQRMKDNPSDPQGWLLLGRSWNALQRYEDAAKAYGEAAARLPGNADVLADWADTLGMAQGRKLAGRPTELIAQALAADPQHPKALALAASAAMERGDDKAAVRYWRQLLAVVPPGSEDAQGIRETIAQLEGGAPGASAPPASAPAASAPAAAVPAAAAARVAGRVVVSPALASRVPPDATLFVFARAPQGSRMPLAVVRRTARELPFEFSLDDSMAMSPAARLSGAREVVVEARVSTSGGATPSPGDLVGQSAVVPPGTTGIVVTIDRVLP